MKGESRGAQPLWQESEGVPQNFFLLPPSYQEAGQGHWGSPEGHSLFGRGLGVSPRASISSPFLEGRGPGGWSELPLRTRSPNPTYRTPPHPRLPRRRLLAMTGVGAGWGPRGMHFGAGYARPVTQGNGIRRGKAGTRTVPACRSVLVYSTFISGKNFWAL